MPPPSSSVRCAQCTQLRQHALRFGKPYGAKRARRSLRVGAKQPDKQAGNAAAGTANDTEGSATDPFGTVEVTTPASKPSRKRLSGKSSKRSNGAKPGSGSESDSDEQSSASRIMKLARGPGGSDRPEYKPRSAAFLARRRMLLKMLPYGWQKGARRAAEAIPSESFSYILSTLSIAASALIGGTLAYFAEPWLKDVIIDLFAAATPEARVSQELTFETQYLAAISFLTAVLFGNTFGLCFDGQRQIVSAMSKEVFALELLLQELFIQIPEPNLRWRVIKQIKRYTDEEIQARDIDSPFRVDGAVVGLFNALLTLRDQEGKNISKMISSVEMLASANSERGALSSQLLPALHWVLLTVLSCLVLTAFLLYDSDFSGTIDENRIIFAVLAAAFLSVLRVLQDISDADDGLYSVRDPIENRLTFVRWQMDNILSDPTIKLSILGNQENDGSDEEQDEDGVWKSNRGHEADQPAQVAGATAAAEGGSSGATRSTSGQKR